MKKKLVLLIKKLYFCLPSVKYDSAGSWKFYSKVLGIKISFADETWNYPKWYIPFIQKIDMWCSDILLAYMKKNKDILREDYCKNRKI